MRFKLKSREQQLAEGYVDMQIVPRSEWEALPPKATEPVTNHPIANVFLTYHTETMSCNTRQECCETLRELQKKHMDQGMDDIAYNFLVGGDGHVYEGRGWHVRPDKTLKFNPEFYENRMDLAYIGDWRDGLIPDVFYVEAMLTWGHRGIKKGYLTKYFENTDIREKGREVWDIMKKYEEEHPDEPFFRMDPRKLTDTTECDLDYTEMAGPGGFMDVQEAERASTEPMAGDGLDMEEVIARSKQKDPRLIIGDDWF